MVKVRVMYWKEIPVQVQAVEVGAPPVSVPLDARFQQGVDAIAMFDGSMGSDDYLMAWEWHDFADVDGTAQGSSELGRCAVQYGTIPADFVARIRDLQNAGQRDAAPGAINHWLDE